jgi:hypothetical protein
MAHLITVMQSGSGGGHAWRIWVPRSCSQLHKPHRNQRRSEAVRQTDSKVNIRLKPKEHGMTKVQIRATVYLRTNCAGARRYLERLSDAHMWTTLNVALPVAAPLGWIELWDGHLSAAEVPHDIRFLYPLEHRQPLDGER